MKKSLLLTLLLLTTALALGLNRPKDAMPREKARFRHSDVTFRGGMSLGFPLGPLVQDAKGVPNPAPSMSAYYNYRFNPKWAGKIGIHYYWMKTSFETPYKDVVYIGDLPITTETGTIYIYDTANIMYTIVKGGLFNNHYISIPMMAEYSIRKGWKVEFGGYVAYLLHSQMTGTATEVITGDGSTLAEPVPFDESKRFNKIDYGAKAGFSYELKNRLLFGMNATVGIRDIFMKDFTAPPGDYHNLIMHFDVGYRLGGNKRM